jgi:DNA-binding CsgD family transcriptional regulator
MQHLIPDKSCVIKPFHGGIKFSRPNAASKHVATFAELMVLSSDVCLIERNAKAIYMNDAALMRSQMLSVKDCLGKTIFDVAKTETAHVINAHHKKTLDNRSLQIMEYDFHCKASEHVQRCLLFSMRWYRDNDEFGGILDLAIVSGRDNLPESLSKLAQMGLLHYSDSPTQEVLKLTKRERECIELLANGHTAKQIAAQLDLSPRTIEHYLENAMNKVNVSTRTELVAEYLKRSSG